MKLKYFLKKFMFLRAYFSPFKPIKPVLYIGKTKIGTPYFLPRVWKKYTPEMADKKAKEEHTNYMKDWSFSQRYDHYIQCLHAVPRKIGFDFSGLGWKTKWTDIDYRFEYSPVWSFVFLEYQIAITWVAPEQHHYWELFLQFYYSTDKNKSWKERIKEARNERSQIWTRYKYGVKEQVDFWEVCLKNKYK